MKRLLAMTDYRLARIAESAEIRHVETMCTLFKKTVGQTPGQCRRENPSFAKKSVPQVLGK